MMMIITTMVAMVEMVRSSVSFHVNGHVGMVPTANWPLLSTAYLRSGNILVASLLPFLHLT